MSSDVEEGPEFAPRFSSDGLLTCVTVDAGDGVVLMVAHMNAEALEKTLASGVVHYWSRARQSLWRKGDTSGQTQTLVELRVDCDQDALLARVRVGGDGGAAIPGGAHVSIVASRRTAKVRDLRKSLRFEPFTDPRIAASP